MLTPRVDWDIWLLFCQRRYYEYDGGQMLGHRLWRCPNFHPALDQSLLLAEYSPQAGSLWYFDANPFCEWHKSKPANTRQSANVGPTSRVRCEYCLTLKVIHPPLYGMNNCVFIWGDWLSCDTLRGSHDSQSPHIRKHCAPSCGNFD